MHRNAVKLFAGRVAGAVLIVLTLPYLRYTVYQPPERKVFSGESWYQPYQEIPAEVYKGNFHAHSRSWLGLTFGEDSEEEVIGAYVRRGYRVPVLSNYHRIAGRDLYPPELVYIPAYEHGFNLQKVHCLCLGAKDVRFHEYPWHFSVHHTNDVIRDLRTNCALIALAHPGARGAHSASDMRLLEGLDLMEMGKGWKTAFWDSTLSSGKAVWLLANDDIHDLGGRDTFHRWNMIFSETAGPEAVMRALDEGSFYSILSYDGACENNRLEAFGIEGDTLHIELRDTFNRLDLIGQNGELLATRARDNRISYPLRLSDTYVRTEVHHDHCVMYLNPVLRYDGATPPYQDRLLQDMDRGRTWLMRSIVLILIAAVMRFLVFPRKRPDRREVRK